MIPICLLLAMKIDQPTQPVKLAAEPFDLKDVAVLGGPLKAAQDADARYLLELNPDGFLNPYRRAAGLTPKAPFYGGWEARNDGNAGEILGHYLSAISKAWAVTGDRRFKERVDHIVDDLAECQAQRSDGALFYDPGLPAAWDAISKGDIKVENPYLNGIATWYRVHKVLDGLFDAQTYAGNEKALAIARKVGDWACAITRNLSEDQWQKMLEAEFGGVNEAFAELSPRTGDPKYLALARRFYHKAVCDPLAAGRDDLAGLHANTQIPKIEGEARIYELTGDPKEKRLAEFFWETVVRHHSYAIGGDSASEHFGPPDKITGALSNEDCETCCTYNMEKLTRHLFAWHPKAEYADWYERALFNHILGSQDPETGMMCYFVPLESGHERKFSTPFDSFWCCVGTGMENHMLHGSAIYYKRGADRLWVNLFVPSRVKWSEAGVEIRQETRFPEDGAVTLTIASKTPREFALSIRRPSWAIAKPVLKVNGRAISADAGSDGYLTVRRRWKSGDKIAVQYSMTLRVEPAPGDPSMVTLAYGPIVLSADMDEPVAKPSSTEDKPVLVTKGRPIGEWLQRIPGEGVRFESVKAVEPADYVFRPYAEIRHHRTATYFKLYTAVEWAAEAAKHHG